MFNVYFQIEKKRGQKELSSCYLRRYETLQIQAGCELLYFIVFDVDQAPFFFIKTGEVIDEFLLSTRGERRRK